MSSVDGSGALALIGQNPIPQGTPDELRKQGVDPANIASCAPQSPGVRGCSMWKECPFHLTQYGGFKGLTGPRNVAYYMKTHENKQKQDFMPCHSFVKVMLSRMQEGVAQAMKGKPHEVIRIIGVDGTTIRQRVGVPVNEADTSINAKWKMETRQVVVPALPRPGENHQTSYDAELWAEEQARRGSDPAFQTGPDAFDEVADGEPFSDDDAVLDLSPPAKGKGK